MSRIDLFSVGEQWDWDRFIDLHLGENYFEKVVKQIFKKEYDKTFHYNDIKSLYRHIPENDLAIRFDNCFAKTNLEESADLVYAKICLLHENKFASKLINLK